MFQFLISVFLSLLVVGCSGPRYVDYFPYHNDGTLKPRVALLPIIDSTHNRLPWSLSEEIADGIYYELMNSGEFYVVSPKEMGLGWMHRHSIDCFSNDDLSFAEEFENTDFIVAMEIIERTSFACDPCNQAIKKYPDSHPSNLNMILRVRIKILDIRCNIPKIVLYEVFNSCYAGTQDCNAAEEICWKNPSYPRSYCARAHQRAVRNLTQRLENVIWSAK